MIQTFDDIIPLVDRTWLYGMTIKSNYQIQGWSDRDDLELSNKHDLHSKWSWEDLERSKILPYIEKVLKKSKFSKYTLNDFTGCTINAVKPGDYYYIHTHLKGSISILYYINLNWRPEWAGETLFYTDNMKDVKFTSPYVPGRFILFDHEPHTIRSQTINGPAWRFTLALFLQK
jgi:Rps23 Pro-64 3,4-dihydroxylase Tpa1-like proline 4-hydroxylase|tara:strand:+ start:496 stop:1017 length:522 start_codon:yes stop_codon:yes gene_type:complete